jgi:hypothetical protein
MVIIDLRAGTAVLARECGAIFAASLLTFSGHWVVLLVGMLAETFQIL